MIDLMLATALLEKHPFGPESIVVTHIGDEWTIETMTSFERMAQDGVHALGTGCTPEEAFENFIAFLREEVSSYDSAHSSKGL